MTKFIIYIIAINLVNGNLISFFRHQILFTDALLIVAMS